MRPVCNRIVAEDKSNTACIVFFGTHHHRHLVEQTTRGLEDLMLEPLRFKARLQCVSLWALSAQHDWPSTDAADDDMPAPIGMVALNSRASQANRPQLRHNATMVAITRS